MKRFLVLLVFVVGCANDTLVDSDIMSSSYQNYLKNTPSDENKTHDSQSVSPSLNVGANDDTNSSSLNDSSDDTDLEQGVTPTALATSTKPQLSQEQFAILFDACHKFQEARDCFLNANNTVTRGICYSKWRTPVKESKDRLIENGFITREKYKELRAKFDAAKKRCKKEAYEKYADWRWVAIGNYRAECSFPFAIEDSNKTFAYFQCEEVLANGS